MCPECKAKEKCGECVADDWRVSIIIEEYYRELEEKGIEIL